MAAKDPKTYFEFSDDEEQEETDDKMPFGKYKNASIKYLCSHTRETRQYLKFVLTLTDLDNSVRNAINKHMADPELLPAPLLFEDAVLLVMPFGIHKGDTLEELVRSHGGRCYLQNLLRWEKLSVNLIEHIQVVLAEYHKLKKMWKM